MTKTPMQIQRYQELTEKLTAVFSQQVPFHNFIGFEFSEVSAESCLIKFKMKPELVGNFVHGILHGGVTATALDVVGGIMAAAAMLDKNLDASDELISRKIAKIGTIDLRVDYLRPGKGEAFYAKARILRIGNKVAVVRMELHSQDDTLLALGTGTYMTG